MEKILVRTSYSYECYDPSQSFAPTINLDLAAGTSKILSLCALTVKKPNINELPERIVPLANLDQTMDCTSSGSKTLSLCIPTVKMPNISELPEGTVPLANLDQTMDCTSSG
ncbi:uncharacterized protein LOC112680231 [Sipha flava]|uniref:Uncharacterized protein LOC112680231 n=1 Tax=Sipha flava TaxID=143950 RepID=A0A8B8F5G5_9HEMI|nr:uncharacterized protein LOC112680231 [Sipha flava]